MSLPTSFARYDCFLLVAISCLAETSAKMFEILVLVSRLTFFSGSGSLAVIYYYSVCSSLDIPLGVFRASFGDRKLAVFLTDRYLLVAVWDRALYRCDWNEVLCLFLIGDT